MANVFMFTGRSIEEVDFIGDCYLQLVLIQHSIKSVRQPVYGTKILKARNGKTGRV